MTKKLANIFKKAKTVSYKTDNTVYNEIKTNNETDQHNKNGIYKLECPDCNKCYIGQTKNRLKDR